MTADRRMDAFQYSPGMPKDSAAELAEARLAGEGDVLFFCRYTRQKIDRYMEACSALSAMRVNGAGKESIDKAESGVRHARRYLEGATDLLNETINEKKQ